MGYFLMIKTLESHNIKYLCKCKDYKDPYLYKGSGVFWRKIINKYSDCKINTTILGHYDTNEELRKAGEYFSSLYNIVEDKSWANLIPEIGDGGPTTKNRIRAYNINTNEQCFFDSITDIPDNWVRGAPKWKKTRESIEKTRIAHLGKKRSLETRIKMKESVRKPRLVIMCEYCNNIFTKQNIERHIIAQHKRK